ncbi:MAG: hypothetical protein AAFP81_00850 [Pseudomonadota bacterium]
MKVKITERGAHGPSGNPLEVGKVFDIPGGKLPAFLVGKVTVIGEEPPVEGKIEGKTAIKNPEKKEPAKKEPEKTGDPQKTEQPVEDEISKMSDEQLSEAYKAAKGRAHHPDMKRENIEAVVREAKNDT